MFAFQKNLSSFDTVVRSHYFEFNPSQPSWRNFDIANFPSAQAELGRGWNRTNQSEPNPVANLTLPSVLCVGRQSEGTLQGGGF